MKFIKGDKILVTSNPGVPGLDIPWPQSAVVIANAQPTHPNSSPYCDNYVVELPLSELSYNEKDRLVREGYRIPLRVNCSGRLLRRDKYCPVCAIAIKTYSERNLVVEHTCCTLTPEGNPGKTVVCYGSHSPLDL